MSPNDKVNQILKGEIARRRKKKESEATEEITFKQYLELVEQDPLIAQNAYGRILEMILSEGVDEIPENERWLGADKEYRFFTKELFGLEHVNSKFVDYLQAGAHHASTGKLVCLLVGPPGTGKSTMVRLLKEGLQNYNLRTIYAIKGCPKWEEPLHLLPPNGREKVEEMLGVRIKGDLCPVCRHTLLDSDEYKSEEGDLLLGKIPVVPFTFSMRAPRGLTSFEPSDEKSSDITALTGRENSRVCISEGYDKWNSYYLSGEIPKAERGICEGRELTSSDPEILRVFFSVAEERELKIQGSPFPHISTDTVIIGHTNINPYSKFQANKEYEGLHQRFFVIPYPYPLRPKDEVKVYKKLIEEDSDFVKLGQCHLAPGALDIAAIFAAMTRHVKSEHEGVGPLTKAKLYNGDIGLIELEDQDQRPQNLGELLDEGQNHDDLGKREGMFGVSSRDVLVALNGAIVKQTERKKCVTPLTVIGAIRDMFESRSRVGYGPEEIKEFLSLLSSADSESVYTEYRSFALETVSKAFLKAYADLTKKTFVKYVKEVSLYRRSRRKYIEGKSSNVPRDEVTGKPREPDLRFLRSVEQHIPLTEEEAETFRAEILETAGENVEESNVSMDDYPRLAQGIKKKLIDESRSSLATILSSEKPHEDTEKRRVEDLYASLKKEGHCQVCAEELVRKAEEFLSE